LQVGEWDEVLSTSRPFSPCGRRDFSDFCFSCFASMSCLINKFEIYARLHIGSEIGTVVWSMKGELRRAGAALLRKSTLSLIDGRCFILAASSSRIALSELCWNCFA
jgi:hypothetical protein